MKTKFLLPMIAMIFAIGMSFASVNTDVIQAKDYVLENGVWKPINEVNCGVGTRICQVQFGEGGPVYDLYNEMNTNSLKRGSAKVPIIVNP